MSADVFHAIRGLAPSRPVALRRSWDPQRLRSFRVPEVDRNRKVSALGKYAAEAVGAAKVEGR